MTDNKENILVVDDTPDNLRLIAAMLSEQGYQVRKSLNGQMALNTVQTVPPDLILLDINMPEMNGYEVCQLLKTNEQTKDIPIIFISALDDVLDKVKAFKVGGIDYITKPFQAEEVLVRIQNQLTIRRQQKQLQIQNEQLQTEINYRQKAEDTLRVYLHTVSHDLRNPVIGMSMVLKSLLKRQSIETISVPISILERMESSCDRQLNLINSLVETQQFEISGVPLQCKSVNLYSLIQQLALEWEPILTKNQATLENTVSPDLPSLKADFYQLWRVFENLIANSLKHNPPGINLVINAEVLQAEEDRESNNSSSSAFQMIRCTVADNGVGMNLEQAEGLFERYQRGKATKQTLGLGLGLYLCRQIINAHGGEIDLITTANQGTIFWFTLPIEEGRRQRAEGRR